jgi:hypothetical protein
MSRNSNEAGDLTRTVVRLHTGVLAFACAVIGGVGLFALTALLLIKGGAHVGAHLQLLSQYFCGYSVTWRGSLLGLLYGAVTGGAVGWLIGTVYNGVVGLRR